MGRAAAIVLCAVVTSVLSGCPGPRVLDVDVSPEWPERAAGFERERVIAYRLDRSDLSVGYNLLSPEAQIAATIYLADIGVYPGIHAHGTPMWTLYQANKATIQQHHPGARLLDEDIVTLTRHGREYTALRAVYRYDDVFMGRRQRVHSVLMIWRHRDTFVKLRSTMPYDQRALAESNYLALLDAVDWTVKPS